MLTTLLACLMLSGDAPTLPHARPQDPAMKARHQAEILRTIERRRQRKAAIRRRNEEEEKKSDKCRLCDRKPCRCDGP